MAEGLVAPWVLMLAADSADLLVVTRAAAWAAWRAGEMAGLSVCWWVDVWAVSSDERLAASWAAPSVALWVDVWALMLAASWAVERVAW